jgi:hypothetical protein
MYISPIRGLLLVAKVHALHDEVADGVLTAASVRSLIYPRARRRTSRANVWRRRPGQAAAPRGACARHSASVDTYEQRLARSKTPMTCDIALIIEITTLLLWHIGDNGNTIHVNQDNIIIVITKKACNYNNGNCDDDNNGSDTCSNGFCAAPGPAPGTTRGPAPGQQRYDVRSEY